VNFVHHHARPQMGEKKIRRINFVGKRRKGRTVVETEEPRGRESLGAIVPVCPQKKKGGPIFNGGWGGKEKKRLRRPWARGFIEGERINGRISKKKQLEKQIVLTILFCGEKKKKKPTVRPTGLTVAEEEASTLSGRDVTNQLALKTKEFGFDLRRIKKEVQRSDRTSYCVIHQLTMGRQSKGEPAYSHTATQKEGEKGGGENALDSCFVVQREGEEPKLGHLSEQKKGKNVLCFLILGGREKKKKTPTRRRLHLAEPQEKGGTGSSRPILDRRGKGKKGRNALLGRKEKGEPPREKEKNRENSSVGKREKSFLTSEGGKKESNPEARFHPGGRVRACFLNRLE